MARLKKIHSIPPQSTGLKIRCRNCGALIESKTPKQFVACSCGKVYIDAGDDYVRIGYDKPEDVLLENWQPFPWKNVRP